MLVFERYVKTEQYVRGYETRKNLFFPQYGDDVIVRHGTREITILYSTFVGGEPVDEVGLSLMLKVILNVDLKQKMGLSEYDVLNVTGTCRFLRKGFEKHSTRMFTQLDEKYVGKTGAYVLTDRLLKTERVELKSLTKEVASLRGKLKRREANLEENEKDLRIFEELLSEAEDSKKKKSLKGKIATREKNIVATKKEIAELKRELEEYLEDRKEKRVEVEGIKKKLKV